MEKLQIIEQKIRHLTKKLLELKEENQKLKAELKFFETESVRQKKLKMDAEILQNQKIQIKNKITELLNKFQQAGL
ncbi:MAG: hypothetical protein QME68_00295 [Elusimicrobiota bacterium]|nr:hypothetical protein [Elusimicrobiota bacterium]